MHGSKSLSYVPFIIVSDLLTAVPDSTQSSPLLFPAQQLDASDHVTLLLRTPRGSNLSQNQTLSPYRGLQGSDLPCFISPYFSLVPDYTELRLLPGFLVSCLLTEISAQ